MRGETSIQDLCSAFTGPCLGYGLDHWTIQQQSCVLWFISNLLPTCWHPICFSCWAKSWCSHGSTCQLKFYRQARFSFHAKLHNHLLQISPSPLLPSLYKILLQFCILQCINARELMCIKIKFGGFVLDMICHLTSESNTHKQGGKWFLQENRHGKSNHTLLFAALVGIRLLKVKLNTKSSLFCWWQESIKPAAAFWCHPPSHPVPFDQGIVA